MRIERRMLFQNEAIAEYVDNKMLEKYICEKYL